MGSYQQQIKEPTSQDHAEDVLYTIKKSDYVGRYIVASRDIKPGENIFSDKPACIGRLNDLISKCTLAERACMDLKSYFCFDLRQASGSSPEVKS